MALLQIEGITRRFGGIVALRGVSLEASRGEVHAILGENGAGKSTLISVLCGVITPDEGRMALRGEPFRPAAPDEAERAGISAVFQELSLIPDMTAAENIWFRREPRTRLRTIARSRLLLQTARLLETLDLGLLPIDVPVRFLSVAERQLVEITKALASDPDILILDEATSALPPREVDWLLAVARRRADAGKLVLYISHRLAEVRRIADRITVLRNGESVGTRTAASLADDEIVTMMLGRRLDRLYPERRATRTARVALEAEGLSVGYRLRSVDLALYEGEILGVAGLQGHGQRELFLALYGLLPSRGRILVWGRPTIIRSPHHALSAGIGMALLPEDRRGQGLLLSKSVRENLTLAVLPDLARRGLLDLRREARLVSDAIRRLRIKLDTPEQIAGTLSGGNQQKVVLAKLLTTRARILLFYDPTRGVDVGTKAEIFQLMRELAAQGYAILFYSTDLPELTHVADRVAVLSYGRIAAVLDGQALAEEPILHATLAEQEVA
jgi:ribose transport system ATP-binding protein